MKDIGFKVQSNQNYEVSILKKYINFTNLSIFEVGVCELGSFFLFIGNLQSIKIFQVSISYFLPTNFNNLE